jgi:hypothetical protein
MKKLTLTIAIIFTCFAGIAQQNYHSPNLDKFIGTWTFSKDGKEFEIVLRVATETIVNQTHTLDVLQGFHIYKLNGKTIDNSEERNEVSLDAGLVQDRTDPNMVTFVFFDKQKQKSGHVTIIFIPGHPDKIRWMLLNTEGPKFQLKGQPAFDKTFTVPEYITLERKN